MCRAYGTLYVIRLFNQRVKTRCYKMVRAYGSLKNKINKMKMKLDKIFQPFFITKPTGQGTGLGLSLSYDIIKAHGGELKVEILSAGKAGAGAEFVIILPLY